MARQAKGNADSGAGNLDLSGRLWREVGRAKAIASTAIFAIAAGCVVVVVAGIALYIVFSMGYMDDMLADIPPEVLLFFMLIGWWILIVMAFY